MKKKLEEMTNKELWQLFPIVLVEHDPSWKQEYENEKALLECIIGIENIARISHVGSTAVAGLLAKPTIDILLELKPDVDIAGFVTDMKDKGYIYLPKPGNASLHMTFLKGYTSEGYRGQVFHVHVRYTGDWDELYFRDYLLEHPDVAAEYGRLKHRLAREVQTRPGRLHRSKRRFY